MRVFAIVEILIVLIAIIGIFMVVREKNLSILYKILWIFFLFLFNFIALICFFIWKNNKEK